MENHGRMLCKLNILGLIVSRDFVMQRFPSLQLSSVLLNLDLFQIINHNETSKKHYLQHQVCKVSLQKNHQAVFEIFGKERKLKK